MPGERKGKAVAAAEAETGKEKEEELFLDAMVDLKFDQETASRRVSPHTQPYGGDLLSLLRTL
jgi:hypothetical protein